MRIDWVWLSMLILIWILAYGGVFYIDSNEPYEYKLYTENTNRAYPFQYKHTFKCINTDSAYLVEGDKVSCTYSVETQEENISFIPQIDIFLNGLKIRKDEAIISTFEEINITNTLKVTNSSPQKIEFDFYPQRSGNYDISLQSKFYNPSLIYEIKGPINLSLYLDIKSENEASSWWYWNKRNDRPYEKNISKTYGDLSIWFKCVEIKRMWVEDKKIYCDINITNNGTESLDVTKNLFVFKNSLDVTQNRKMILIDKSMAYTDEISYYSEIEPFESSENWIHLTFNEQGYYKILSSLNIFQTNIKDVKYDDDVIKLSLEVISREEYVQKESNKNKILISLLIAVLFSTPIALNSVKQLILKSVGQKKKIKG